MHCLTLSRVMILNASSQAHPNMGTHMTELKAVFQQDVTHFLSPPLPGLLVYSVQLLWMCWSELGHKEPQIS